MATATAPPPSDRTDPPPKAQDLTNVEVHHRRRFGDEIKGGKGKKTYEPD